MLLVYIILKMAYALVVIFGDPAKSANGAD
jgi:hypothetical protein